MIRALALAALAAAACHHDPSCADVMAHAHALVDGTPAPAIGVATCERSFSGDLRECLADAKDEAGVMACVPRAGRTYPRNEGDLGVAELERRIQLWAAVHGALPAAAPMTPERACCEEMEHVCLGVPSVWTGTWRELGFQPTGELRYRYRVERPSDDRVIVRANADLDCDASTTTWIAGTVDRTTSAGVVIGKPIHQSDDF